MQAIQEQTSTTKPTAVYTLQEAVVPMGESLL